MKETQFNRGSWLALGAASLLILIVLGVNAYRFTLPTDGWAYEGYGGGFFMDLMGLPSGIRPGDIPVSIGGIPIEQISDSAFFAPVRAPENWQAGDTVQYTLKRGDATLTLDVPIVNWDLESAGRAMMTWFRSSWTGNLIAIFYFLIGAFVFFRRPGNLAAQVLFFLGTVQLAMTFILFSTLGDFMDPFAVKAFSLLANYIWGILLFPTLFLLSLVFPKPKRPFNTHPRLTLAGLYLLEPMTLLLFGRLSTMAGGIIGFGLVALYGLLTVISIVHSFFRVRSDPVARAQVMWVGFGIALMAGYQFVSNVLLLSTNFGIFYGRSWWMSLIDGLVWLSLPITVAVAIMRYRLFDIDIIIRRTLQYTLVTGLLALIYIGSVILLQSLFTAVGGQQSPVVIVLSTLIIAALFNPLRSRIQDFIDRRFYRRKYNADQALSRFMDTARNEVELEKLNEAMLGVVKETMQPEQVSLWLKERTS